MILCCTGWKVEAVIPDVPKYVIIGAPHTSNWDFFLTLLIGFSAGIKLHWVGKDSLFHWPFGGLMKLLGGIPVKRGARSGFVDQIVAAFQEHDELVICIAPKGTRGKTRYWKTGFYYIALGAGVPIALGFVDYARKMCGVGPTIMPTGDIQADLVPIREFYADKTGKFPHQQDVIEIHS